MFMITDKKTGEFVFCDSRKEAESFVKLFVYIKNKQHYRHDNKNNYSIEEIHEECLGSIDSLPEIIAERA